ncbi:MAG: hypothetical protein WBY94_05575 [Polyangiaceae bacterium]
MSRNVYIVDAGTVSSDDGGGTRTLAGHLAAESVDGAIAVWPPVSAVAGHFPELPPIPPSAPPPPARIKRVVKWGDGFGCNANRYGTRAPIDGRKRCPQCWAIKDFPKRFDGLQMCNECRSDRSTQTPRGPRS